MPESSFETFVLEASPQLMRRASALTGNRHDAVDLVQDALIRVGARWNRIDDPVAYAARTMARLHVSRWRRTRREVLGADAPAEETHDPLAQVDERDALVAGLARLTDRQRTVVVLHYVYDLPVAEISGQLAMKESTVLSHLHRARAALRRDLADDGTPTPQRPSRGATP